MSIRNESFEGPDEAAAVGAGEAQKDSFQQIKQAASYHMQEINKLLGQGLPKRTRSLLLDALRRASGAASAGQAPTWLQVKMRTRKTVPDAGRSRSQQV